MVAERRRAAPCSALAGYTNSTADNVLPLVYVCYGLPLAVRGASDVRVAAGPTNAKRLPLLPLAP